MKNIIIDVAGHIVFNPADVYVTVDGLGGATLHVYNASKYGGESILYRNGSLAYKALETLLADIRREIEKPNNAVYCVVSTAGKTGN